MAKYKNNVSPFLKNVNRQLKSVSRKKTPIALDINIKASRSKEIEELVDKIGASAQAAHRKALHFVADDLYIALGLAMESKVWNWEYGDGDIVDTGALRDSLSISVAGDQIIVSYGQEYAAIVYFGGYIHPYGNPNVQIYMPGRPWIEAVFTGSYGIEQFNLIGAYEAKFLNLLKDELG